MIRINLLPHREEKRKALRQQFYALSGLIAVLAGLIVVMVHGAISGYISQQEGKNAFLKKEIASLDKEIDEIKRLKEQTDALLSRKRVIESLQSNRTETVRLFNELARQVPDGIYLKSVKQTGAKVNVTGYAQSNARVSTLMRNLEASPLMEAPNLVEIKTVDVKLGAATRRLAEFNMNVAITRAAAEEAKKGAPPPRQDKKA
ncbi:MAG: fimbrial protein [Rhodocyclaceae bacterium]|nr:fimbrial protein [Rhodocyclaceae bacterium]